MDDQKDEDTRKKGNMAEKLVFFDKMVEICPDFKWLSLQISDPICKPTSFRPFNIQTSPVL